MKEIWKDIPGYEGLYQASSEGRIKSLDRRVINKRGNAQFFKGKLRKLILSHNGYYRVLLNKDRLAKYQPVHRLVALAFVPNFFNKKQINHKDGNKINNQFSNLEWMTIKENTIHAYRTGLANNKGESHSQSVLKDTEVIIIRNSNKTNKELANEYKVPITTINNILAKRTYKHL